MVALKYENLYLSIMIEYISVAKSWLHQTKHRLVPAPNFEWAKISTPRVLECLIGEKGK